MPKISRKVSVYGDSMCVSQLGSPTRAQYLGSAFGAGYNDYGVGGQTARDTVRGVASHNGSQLFPGGRNFVDHINQTDDCDICVISLGGNDAPFQRGSDITPIPANSPAQTYLGSEYLQIAADIRYLSNIAIQAGKRAVVIGMPYLDINRAVNGPFDSGQPAVGQLFSDKEAAQGFATRLAATQAACRVVCGLWSTPFITPYGGTPAEWAVQPHPDFNSTRDGLHPTAAYANAVNAYIAGRITSIFGL